MYFNVDPSLKFRFICATRVNEEQFFHETQLGMSKVFFELPNAELRLFSNNTLPLPVVYNQAVDEAKNDPAVLVFIHDDVTLLDYYWPEHLNEALHQFDIAGLAGNRRRLPRQPSWFFTDDQFTKEFADYGSGRICHSKTFPPARIDFFGTPGVPLKMVDGVFIAVRSETLWSKGLRFDEQFSFHFYDMDFCRTAELLGLSMGIATVSILHGSVGNLNSDEWRLNYNKYLTKWGEV